MKYTILGFNQSKAIEYGLDTDDLLILRWFVDFKGTDKMATIKDNDKVYYWINYSKILEDIPILNVSKERIKKKHFNKLCNCKVLNHKYINDGGSYSYYSLGENYLSLIEDLGGRSKMTEGVGQNQPRGLVKNDLPNIDILNNNSISNYSNISSSLINNNIYDILEQNGFILTPIHYEVIQQWDDNELTRYAIKKAVLNGKYNINYIDKILFNWKKDNITTLEQAKAQEDEFEKAKEFREKLKNERKMSFSEKLDMWSKEWEEEEKND